jgi:hypothetical protein
VILDPVVKAKIKVSNIQDTSIGKYGSIGYKKAVLECGVYTNGSYADRGPQRVLIKYDELPELNAADTIVSAKFRLYKPTDASSVKTVEVHKFLNEWTDTEVTSWEQVEDFDPIVEDYAQINDTGFYYWDITDIVQGWYSTGNTGMLFKMTDAVEQAEDAWLIAADGKLLERISLGQSDEYLRIIGCELLLPTAGTYLAMGENSIFGQERLLELLETLGRKNMLPYTEVIDCSDEKNLWISYGGRFDVQLLYDADFDKKLYALQLVIETLEDNETGTVILTAPDRTSFKPGRK